MKYKVTLWEESSLIYDIESDEPITEEIFWEIRRHHDHKQVWGDYSIEIEEVSE
jgi:hypothetical protein